MVILSRITIFIGLHLLCLPKTAQPMVLLTANIEDIKKLARRFVSDDVAEQLADFILKASNGMKTEKISEENDKNVKMIEDVSHDKIDRADDEITKPKKHRSKKKYSKEPSIYRKPESKDGVVINVNWDGHSTDAPFEGYTTLMRNRKEKDRSGINSLSDDSRFGYRNYRHIDNAPKYNDGDTTDIVATSGSIGLPELRKTWW